MGGGADGRMKGGLGQGWEHILSSTGQMASPDEDREQTDLQGENQAYGVDSSWAS